MATKERVINKDLRDVIDLGAITNLKQILLDGIGAPKDIDVDFMLSIRGDYMYAELYVTGQLLLRCSNFLPDKFDDEEIERELLEEFIRTYQKEYSDIITKCKTLKLGKYASWKKE